MFNYMQRQTTKRDVCFLLKLFDIKVYNIEVGIRMPLGHSIATECTLATNTATLSLVISCWHIPTVHKHA